MSKQDNIIFISTALINSHFHPILRAINIPCFWCWCRYGQSSEEGIVRARPIDAEPVKFTPTISCSNLWALVSCYTAWENINCLKWCYNLYQNKYIYVHVVQNFHFSCVMIKCTNIEIQNVYIIVLLSSIFVNLCVVLCVYFQI